MAHELSIRGDGFVEMAYVGELPWHGLGNSVPKNAPLREWRVRAGLDWEAKEAVVQYHNEDGLLLPVESKKVLYRSDTSQPVGVVSSGYNVVQPNDLLQSFRDLVESGGWWIHTAGVLRGGSKLWVMATRSDIDVQSVMPGDKVMPHLLGATSLDGSMKSTFVLTAVRGVCANTVGMAIHGAYGSNKIEMSHRSVFNPDLIKEGLGVAVISYEEFMEQARRLAQLPIKVSQATEVLRDLFGQPTLKDIKPEHDDYAFQRVMAQFTKTGDQKVREQRSVARCLNLFQGEGLGADMKGSEGTRWGLLNAITQHVDHEMGRSNDTRMESAWFGRGADIKSQALEVLIEA